MNGEIWSTTLRWQKYEVPENSDLNQCSRHCGSVIIVPGINVCVELFLILLDISDK